eukprot:14766-Hanusia_phi.AAC.1
MQSPPPLKITVIPRKRKNEEQNTRQPITLDKETLQEYQKYSQREAAGKLDISLTALKNACKYVGINNWSDFQKASNHIPNFASPASEDSDTMSQTNSSSSSAGTDDMSVYDNNTYEDDKIWLRSNSFFHDEIFQEVLEHMQSEKDNDC